jgi:hypothetical protein
MKTNDLVVLVHGFIRNKRDMITLSNNLQRMGYNVLAVNLPTRFKSLEKCSELFEEKLIEISKGLTDSQKIHLVGHSMGGLIIRSVLTKDLKINLGRCVFIAPPNKGSKLADIAKAICKYSIEILKPLKSLINGGVNIPLSSLHKPEIGVIAGSKNNILLGVFLSKESDGKVEIESTKLDEMTDFIIQNYNHDEIHHKSETAELVHNFLQSGRFFSS